MLLPKVSEIKERRLNANLSQPQLSNKSGLPDNAIYRIESGKSKTTHPLRAREIAKALRCKIEDIFDEV